MAVLRQSLGSDPVLARDVAQVLVEVWRERVLAHAEAEEAALYVVLRQAPWAERASRLLRDHDLLRTWVGEAEAALTQGARVTPAALARLEALLVLRARHEDDEEALVAEAAAAGAFAVREHADPPKEATADG